jgi:tetratricopeptide (TPR) repeat protein
MTPTARPAADLDAARALHRAGKLAEAEAIYRAILLAEPRHADAYYLLGIMAHQKGDHAGGAALIRQALAVDEGKAEYWYNLGVVLVALKDFGGAAAACRRALALKPDEPDTWNVLGVALAGLGRFEDAAAAYQEAAARDPANADVHNNLAAARLELGCLDEAATAVDQALAARPSFAQAWHNLACIRREQSRCDDGLAAVDRALALDPDFHEAWLAKGALLGDAGRTDEAIAVYRDLIARAPDCAEAHFHLATDLLLTGVFAEGWREHEWRWRRGPQQYRRRDFEPPMWDGGDFVGKTLLIHAEQGIGDTFQFIRFAALAKARGGAVVVEAPARLHALLNTAAGIDRLVASGGPLPPFATHAPLLSLPLIFGTDLASIPAPGRYLAADPALVRRWRMRLEALPRPWVGLAWQGSPTYRGDRRRSIPLKLFAGLVREGPASFISLQKGPGEEQIAASGLAEVLHHFAAAVDVGPDAFVDTAAIIENLDLVITSDTAVPHLAGALGRPVWTLLPFAPDWRWLLGREDSPWYPTMRLFRQKSSGDWPEVIARVAVALARFAALENGA